MKIIDELTQTPLPTEATTGDDPCETSATDPDGPTHFSWFCTRAAGHEGPHVATYDDEERETSFVGLAWTDE